MIARTRLISIWPAEDDAEHDRRYRVARNAERHDRDRRAADVGTVRGFGSQ
jgi:hypothetical protein